MAWHPKPTVALVTGAGKLGGPPGATPDGKTSSHSADHVQRRSPHPLCLALHSRPAQTLLARLQPPEAREDEYLFESSDESQALRARARRFTCRFRSSRSCLNSDYYGAVRAQQ